MDFITTRYESERQNFFDTARDRRPIAERLILSGLNDHCVKGYEFEPAVLKQSAVFRAIDRNMRNRDELCRQGQADYKMLMAGFMKIPLDQKTMERLRTPGWREAELLQKPYN